MFESHMPSQRFLQAKLHSALRASEILVEIMLRRHVTSKISGRRHAFAADLTDKRKSLFVGLFLVLAALVYVAISLSAVAASRAALVLLTLGA